MYTKIEEIEINLWDILKRENKEDEFYDMVTEYITEKTGFCVNGYGMDDNIKIKITNLDLDTTD